MRYDLGLDLIGAARGIQIVNRLLRATLMF
jgi:hypothetical protein